MRQPTKRERLTAQIAALGFSDVHLTPMTGAWRTNQRLDVNRWEGSGRTAGFLDQPHGIRVSFHSWSTMTDCLRYGFDAEPGRSWWQIDVSARAPTTKSQE